jgi:cytochrome oxidase Cu insertion factor (SCO1/SenC/PrrC family)
MRFVLIAALACLVWSLPVSGQKVPTVSGQKAKATTDPALAMPAIGDPAPEITGKDIHGKKFKLSDYKGKVVLLTFWATW